MHARMRMRMRVRYRGVCARVEDEDLRAELLAQPGRRVQRSLTRSVLLVRVRPSAQQRLQQQRAPGLHRNVQLRARAEEQREGVREGDNEQGRYAGGQSSQWGSEVGGQRRGSERLE